MSDPIDDFLRRDMEIADEEEKYPACDVCGRTITDETYFEISGETLCEECMRDAYLRFTRDYITERGNCEIQDFEE